MNDLRDLYQEVILDHGRNPRNRRHPADANHQARGDNPLCGDQLVVYLTLRDGLIADAAFEGRGCAISLASSSLMTEIIRGKTPEQAKALFDSFRDLATHGESPVPADLEDDMERLRVLSGIRDYPVRIKCATLAWHAMAAALEAQPCATTE